MQGLTEGGIVGCGKHFPGHGDTTVDSHLELPILKATEHSAARLREVEMRPFRRAIGQGVPMIMTAHILCEAFDPNLPATLSPKLIDELLRSELGYRGMIVSDDLEMKAVADHWGVGPAAVAAINAGCDLCLVCKSKEAIKEAHQNLARAIGDGIIDKFTLSAIARRRAKLVSRVAKTNRKELRAGYDSECIGNSEHQRLSDSFAQS